MSAGQVPARRRRGWWAALIGALACLGVAGAHPASSAEDLESHLEQRWFYTEVIVFQRPTVMDYASTEALVTPPRPLPRSLRTFRTGQPLWSQYPLHPGTRPFLVFPYLDQSLLAPVEDGGESAGERPAEPAPGPEPAADATTQAAAPAISPVLESDPLLDFLAAVAEFEAGLEARSYQWLDSNTFTLSAMANQLRRSAGYQVLLHGRWLQPVPARDAPEALLVDAGPRLGGVPALQGTFDVTLGRYLHFNANLYYREPLLGRAPVEQAIPPPGLDAPAAPALDLDKLDADGFMQLRQSRRLRSDEVHYVDHPKLGIIVKIQAAEPPPALLNALDALEEGQQ